MYTPWNRHHLQYNEPRHHPQSSLVPLGTYLPSWLSTPFSGFPSQCAFAHCRLVFTVYDFIQVPSYSIYSNFILLFWLTVIILRFFHIVAHISCDSFVLLSGRDTQVVSYISIDEHLGYLQFGAATKNTVNLWINIYMVLNERNQFHIIYQSFQTPVK